MLNKRVNGQAIDDAVNFNILGLMQSEPLALFGLSDFSMSKISVEVNVILLSLDAVEKLFSGSVAPDVSNLAFCKKNWLKDSAFFRGSFVTDPSGR